MSPLLPKRTPELPTNVVALANREGRSQIAVNHGFGELAVRQRLKIASLALLELDCLANDIGPVS